MKAPGASQRWQLRNASLPADVSMALANSLNSFRISVNLHHAFEAGMVTNSNPTSNPTVFFSTTDCVRKPCHDALQFTTHHSGLVTIFSFFGGVVKKSWII